jgi:hypothetical protein
MPTDLKVELKKMVEDRMKPVRRSVSPRWMQYPYTIASWRPPVGLALASGLFICAMFWTNKWFIGKISMALVRCHPYTIASWRPPVGVRGYGSIVYAQTYADDSGSSKINTGHLLLAVTVLCATVIPYDGVEEHQKQTIRTICRLVRDITPKHKEIAETDDLQIPVSPAAQQMVVLPPKPQSEDGPVKLQPAERVVTPEAFVGIIGPLCAAFPRGFESVHLQTLLAAALEAYEPSDLALTLEDLVSVMRLLGWKNVARFAGLIKRLAKQRNVSVQTVQERYNSITGPVTQETHGEIGILLQILSGNPPRKLGEPIDWLKNNRQEQKPEGSLPEWP